MMPPMGLFMRILLSTTFAAATLVPTANAVEYRFYHPDPLGSNVVVTNRSGEVVQRMVHMPYGELRAVVDGAGNSISPGANDPRHHFTGHEYDAESGLHYMGARHYDPFVGRFMSQDPIVVAAPTLSPNGYAYANNRPTVLIDPTGLMPTPSPAPTPSPEDLQNQRIRELFPNYDPENIGDPFGTGIDVLNFTGLGVNRFTQKFGTAVWKKIGKTFAKGTVKGSFELGVKEGAREIVTQELKADARAAAIARAKALITGRRTNARGRGLPRDDILGRAFEYVNLPGRKTPIRASLGVVDDELVLVAQRIRQFSVAENVLSLARSSAVEGGHPAATVIFQNTLQRNVRSISRVAKEAGFTSVPANSPNTLIFSTKVR